MIESALGSKRASAGPREERALILSRPPCHTTLCRRRAANHQREVAKALASGHDATQSWWVVEPASRTIVAHTRAKVEAALLHTWPDGHAVVVELHRQHRRHLRLRGGHPLRIALFGVFVITVLRAVAAWGRGLRIGGQWGRAARGHRGGLAPHRHDARRQRIWQQPWRRAACADGARAHGRRQDGHAATAALAGHWRADTLGVVEDAGKPILADPGVQVNQALLPTRPDRQTQLVHLRRRAQARRSA
mmetsp:Transcript_119593/g.381621  ORF Transcript_119593/g.381621 Transcript_119593/m.381621 type:complete len:248 (-) Transcript_119593:275-1018(-)